METPVTQPYKFPALIIGTECFTRDGVTKIASDQYEAPADALSEAEKRYMDENATEFALLNGIESPEQKETPVIEIPPQPTPEPTPEPSPFDLNFTRNGVVTTVRVPNQDIPKLNPVHLYNFFHSQGIAAEIFHAVEQK